MSIEQRCDNIWQNCGNFSICLQLTPKKVFNHCEPPWEVRVKKRLPCDFFRGNTSFEPKMNPKLDFSAHVKPFSVTVTASFCGHVNYNSSAHVARSGRSRTDAGNYRDTKMQ